MEIIAVIAIFGLGVLIGIVVDRAIEAGRYPEYPETDL
jgi:hypothetical protein